MIEAELPEGAARRVPVESVGVPPRFVSQSCKGTKPHAATKTAGQLQESTGDSRSSTRKNRGRPLYCFCKSHFHKCTRPLFDLSKPICSWSGSNINFPIWGWFLNSVVPLLTFCSILGGRLFSAYAAKRKPTRRPFLWLETNLPYVLFSPDGLKWNRFYYWNVFLFLIFTSGPNGTWL